MSGTLKELLAAIETLKGAPIPGDGIWLADSMAREAKELASFYPRIDEMTRLGDDRGAENLARDIRYRMQIRRRTRYQAALDLYAGHNPDRDVLDEAARQTLADAKERQAFKQENPDVRLLHDGIVPRSPKNEAGGSTSLDDVKTAVIRVGEGRGFIVQGTEDRFVITAAHCLPRIPPCCSFSHSEERMFQNLLGKLGQEPNVWAECLFLDPIADIAVLGTPDDQAFSEQADSYRGLVEPPPALSISDAPEDSPAFLLSLVNDLMPCIVRHLNGPLWISDATPGIEGGMSGSPIFLADGSVIGVCCVGGGDGDRAIEGGPNPHLAYHLPGWLIRQLMREGA